MDCGYICFVIILVVKALVSNNIKYIFVCLIQIKTYIKFTVILFFFLLSLKNIFEVFLHFDIILKIFGYPNFMICELYIR